MIRLPALVLLAAGVWSWDASPGATGYKFCWSYDATYWNHALCVDVGDDLRFDPSDFDALWAVEANPGMTLFYQVVAYNGAGDDATGQTFAPIPAQWVCP